MAYADTIVYKGLEYLNLQDIEITLLNGESTALAKIMDGQTLSAFIVRNFAHNYTLYIDEDISRTKAIKILAHELIHLEQKESKILIITPNAVF